MPKAKTTKKGVPKKGKKPVKIGKVTHFYNNIKVAIVKFSKPIKSGTLVKFCGGTTDFSQNLDSVQYDHKPITIAPKGKEVGVKVSKRVREGDEVFLA